MFICIIVWIISVMMTLPQIMFTKIESRANDIMLCDVYFPDGKTKYEIEDKIEKMFEDFM